MVNANRQKRENGGKNCWYSSTPIVFCNNLLESNGDLELIVVVHLFQVFNKVMFEMSEGGSETQDKTQDEGIPLKFTVNRPFFFAIVEGNSNAILMLGKIRNPTL